MTHVAPVLFKEKALATGRGSVTVVRGARLLDRRSHRAEPVEILVEGTRIRELGPPGLAVTAGSYCVGLARRPCHIHWFCGQA